MRDSSGGSGEILMEGDGTAATCNDKKSKVELKLT
jgi:hypothetical protein